MGSSSIPSLSGELLSKSSSYFTYIHFFFGQKEPTNTQAKVLLLRMSFFMSLQLHISFIITA